MAYLDWPESQSHSVGNLGSRAACWLVFVAALVVHGAIKTADEYRFIPVRVQNEPKLDYVNLCRRLNNRLILNGH